MFYFLFRVIGALIVTVVLSFFVLLTGVLALGEDPPFALSAVFFFGTLALAIFVFIRMFRREKNRFGL